MVQLSCLVFLACFLQRCETSGEVEGGCENPERSQWINPNLFVTDPNYSLDKIYGSIWYEHWYWTEAVDIHDGFWTSFAIRPRYPIKGYPYIVAVSGTASEKGKCKTFGSTWKFNLYKANCPINVHLQSSGGREASIWFLDQLQEDYLLRATCRWVFKRNWTGVKEECPHWVFTAYFRDPTARDDSLRIEVERKLTSRICYQISKLTFIDPQPSRECTKNLVNNDEERSNKNMFTFFLGALFSVFF